MTRLTGGLPLLTLYAWATFAFGVMAWLHPSPWVFTDELQYAHISRSIWETGEATIRGEPARFENLGSYLLAPVWWIWDVDLAYGVAKYLQVFVMATVVFPTYALARLLLLSRPWSLFAAAGAAFAPAMTFSVLLSEEAFAYPWAALSLYLVCRALLERSRGWIAAAVAVSLVAPVVRGQLAVVPVVFALAALTLLLLDERWRRRRAGWSRWDWAGAALLPIGAALVASEVMGNLSTSWGTAVGFYKLRMVEHGMWAVGAFVIGLGALPVVAGLASLARRSKGEPLPAAQRVFALVLGWSVLAFGFYTAVKASYLSVTFQPRITERNLVYLGPLLFVGTALALARPRLHKVALFAAAALAVVAVTAVPDQSVIRIYSDAPGLSILSRARESLELSPGTLHVLVLLSVAVAVAFLVYSARVVAATLALAWTLTAGLSAAAASTLTSQDFGARFPDPPNWVDRATGGQDAIYLGQGIADPAPVWLLEFWNRTVTGVWSLDATAPGPWPEITPDLRGKRGVLIPQPDVNYVVAEGGVNIDGEVVAREKNWTLLRFTKPLRLRSAVEGIFSDGWTGERSAFTHYTAPGTRAGFVTVSVSRKRWPGPPVEGQVEVRIGPLGIREEQPVIAGVHDKRVADLPGGEQVRFVLLSPPPPFRVEVRVTPTYAPFDFGLSDQRQLGAQVRFSFTRR